MDLEKHDRELIKFMLLFFSDEVYEKWLEDEAYEHWIEWKYCKNKSTHGMEVKR